MTLTPQWLDELRSRITLSALIGRTTRLQKAGREWKACCPFHNEKSPSFTVNDEKGFYHCFGCQAHGDAIRWLTDQRGLAFIDAVKELAAEAGMELPAPDPKAAARAEREQGLHDVMAAAQAFFAQSLAGADGAAARAYLQRRGVAPRAIEQFGFGFAPDSRTALRHALGQFPEAMLIEAGLRIAVDGKEPYDRFRTRLMLPIMDARGRVIAFGGRILEAGPADAPKYLNSPDTPLFDKGRTLYNLHRAAAAARAAGRIVVVEGYMDVVALAGAGIAEAVAPMGTALTEAQLERLWRVHECPVLCLDGDAAGQRAAMRAAQRALPLLRPGHSLRIVTLPEGLDPDDLIRREGRDSIEALLNEGRSLIDLIWESERHAQPLATPEDKAGLKGRLIRHSETIADRDIRALYRRELLDRFDAFAFARRAAPAHPGRSPPGRNAARWQPAEPPLPPAQIAQLQRFGGGEALLGAVLAALIADPPLIGRHVEALARVVPGNAALAALRDAIVALAGRAETLDSAALRTILAERLLPLPRVAERTGFALQPVQLGEAIALLIERPSIEAALAETTRRFERDPEGAFAEQQLLLNRKLAFEQRLRQMANARPAAEG